jgi:acyl-CoA reductase-like NAD-dependent aldehyde dehydrogenase
LAPQPGDGFIHTVDCGSMISSDRFSGLELDIRKAAEDGAMVEGGSRYNHVYHDGGAYFDATIVGGATRDMDIANKECTSFFLHLLICGLLELISWPVFAPVALLMPYDEIDEAIDIANGTPYGLGASVFGPDQRDCISVAKRLECGMVSVNDFGVFYVSSVDFLFELSD